ncbi:hypothetical protein [Bacillus sp. Brlt_9]|uniref:hypothetical protein n=1 Tax=Bacillus sp. Brlt_9 TaxID=3110916 RepID=UPI003F7BDF4A
MKLKEELIRTYTPILPIGKGPCCDEVRDALFDILTDYNERYNPSYVYSDEETKEIIELLIKDLSITTWSNGDFEVFSGYKIVVQTIPKAEFDKLPEFYGY